MGALLWQRTILPEAILLSGLSATGATLDSSTAGRPVIKMPLDDGSDVSVVVRCGRILEPLSSSAPLFVVLSFFSGYTAGSYDFRIQCAAKQPPDDGDGQTWNTTESSLTGSFPSTANNLVHAEVQVATGAARDNLDAGMELDALVRLTPDGGHPADFLYLQEVEVRQELP